MSSSPFMGAEALRERLRENAVEHVGTDDLAEANRRYEVLHSWRYGDE